MLAPAQARVAAGGPGRRLLTPSKPKIKAAYFSMAIDPSCTLKGNTVGDRQNRRESAEELAVS